MRAIGRTILVINDLGPNQKATPLILLRLIQLLRPIQTIDSIVALYQLQMLTAIQIIYVARSALVGNLLVANNPDSNRRLYSQILKNVYYLNRLKLRQSYYQPFYYFTLGAEQRLTNPETAMLPIESISSIYLSIRTDDLLVIPASVTQYLILKYVFRLRTYLASLLSLIPSTKILYQKISGLPSRYLITLRRACF